MFGKIKLPCAAKIYVQISSFILIMVTVFSFSGCILDSDSVETTIQQIAFSKPIQLTGSSTTLSATESVDLGANETYCDLKDRITNIGLEKIAFRTKSVTPANLSGNVTVIGKNSNGVVVFSKEIPNASPAAYINTPYELQLTASELAAVNASIVNNKKFTAIINCTTQTQGVKTIDAVVDIVFQCEVNLVNRI